MNSFLNRNWPVLATVFALILLLVMAQWIPNMNLPGKGLLFRVVEKTPISSPTDHPEPAIGLTIDGKPANEPYLTTFMVTNTGNIAIEADDFETPIHLTLLNESIIIQVRYRLRPSDINTRIDFKPSKATFTPALLNPNDTIVVQVFTSGGEPVFDVGARIEGIEKIFAKESGVDPNWGEVSWLHYTFFLISLFGLFLLTMAMQGALNARYLVLGSRPALALFLSLLLVTLNTYFTFMADHFNTFFSSKLLLIGVSLLTLMLASLMLRHSDRDAP